MIMSVSGVAGFANPYSPQVRTLETEKSKVVAQQTAGSSSSDSTSQVGQIDSVNLSNEAQQKMVDATRISVTKEGVANAATFANDVPDLNAATQRLTPEAMAATAAWRERHTEYTGKVRDLVNQTFGLDASKNGWGANGAALTAIKNLAEKNGLIEPEMPPEMALMTQSNSTSMWDNSGGQATGVFDITSTGDGVGSGGNIRILFDSGMKPGAETTLVGLRDGRDSQGILAGIKGSSLGKTLDAIGGWTANGTTNAYAISSGGGGGNANVVGLVLSTGMDGYAAQKATTILSTLHDLL